MKKGLFSKIAVALLILFFVVFVFKALDVFNNTGAEPSVLISTVSAFVLGELALIRSIKKDKHTEKLSEERRKRTNEKLDNG